MSKVAGLISKDALAQIFARASEIKDQEGERQPGRLGRAMLDELLARARQVRAAGVRSRAYNVGVACKGLR